ncbi:MAG: hypothetical protein AAF393_14195 [Pseudomonadota bacterium]
MTRTKLVLLAVSVLAGCADGGLFQRQGDVQVFAPSKETKRPKARPGNAERLTANRSGGGLNSGGIKLSDAAKVTDSELAAATTPSGGGKALGSTTATLGFLERDGFWLTTPLVKSETEGRVIYSNTGATANVTLIPNGAKAGSGSQISIAAMQVLGIPLTDIATLKVFKK